MVIYGFLDPFNFYKVVRQDDGSFSCLNLITKEKFNISDDLCVGNECLLEDPNIIINTVHLTKRFKLMLSWVYNYLDQDDIDLITTWQNI